MALLENPLVGRAIILVVTAIVAYVLQRVTTRATRKVLEKAQMPNVSIFINIERALIWFLALLAVLEPVFGVQPTAFVAALGVTSIAVSFGLQSTISNIISGFGLMLGRVIEVGDYIEVGGYQGWVTDVTWRSTTIKTILDDVIVIPNSVLNTTTLNKFGPTSERTVTIPIDIHPEADMVAVERDIQESVEAAVKDQEWYDPALGVILIHQGFGSFGFRIDVRVGMRDMRDGLDARHAIVHACSGRPWLARW